MRLKRLEKTRKAVTTVAAVALVAAVSYGVSSLVVGHKPAFALSVNKSFSITSQTLASTCRKTAGVKLYPGTQRCLAVTVHNPLSVALRVTTLKMTVSSFSATATAPAGTCTTATLTVPTLFTSSFVVPEAGTYVIDKPIELKNTNATQDACENGTFNFSYSGSATYTDTTTTTLTATLSGTTGALKATVTPENPSSDPYGPSGAPVHHVTIYICGTTASCATKTAHTVTLTTAGKSTKSATATYDDTSLTTGKNYFEVSYPATSAHTGTFAGSSSAIESLTVAISTKVETVNTLVSFPDPSTAGQPVTFTATVTGTAGTPTGKVNFYLCSSKTNPTTCATWLGTATVNPFTHKASLGDTFTTAGTYYVEARYAGTTKFAASASSILTQKVMSVGTTTTLTSSPNPSLLGQGVTLTATVKRTTGFGTPTGTVTVYLCKTATCHVVTTALGTKALSGGRVTISDSTLSSGTHYFYAAYSGTPTFEASRSSVLTQRVVAPPSVCAPGGYTNFITGYSGGLDSPYFPYYGLFQSFPVVIGTNGNDFIYLPVGSFIANGLNGNDCIYAGTGNNWLFEGAGNDGIEAGNGTNLVIAGNGADEVLLGTGPTDGVTLGNGNDTVVVGNGRGNRVTTGNGTDTVTVGTGAVDRATVGNGAGDTLKVGNGTGDAIGAGGGSHDSVTVGKGNDTVRVGNGNFDKVIVGSGNDTIVVGNGSTLTVTLGNGNDTVRVGNGSKSTLSVGNGRDTVTLGNGSTNTLSVGNGDDTVTLGNGSKNHLSVGAGNDTVMLGTGSTNTLTLGKGTDAVTIRSKGSADTITAGTGTETIHLGSGTHNTFNGSSKTKDTCYVPKPPSSYHGSTPVDYYDDTVTNCTVRTTP